MCSLVPPPPSTDALACVQYTCMYFVELHETHGMRMLTVVADFSWSLNHASTTAILLALYIDRRAPIVPLVHVLVQYGPRGEFELRSNGSLPRFSSPQDDVSYRTTRWPSTGCGTANPVVHIGWRGRYQVPGRRRVDPLRLHTSSEGGGHRSFTTIVSTSGETRNCRQ